MGEIHIENLEKNFDQTQVLKEINLDIPDSSFTIILGPSGCGKSTLLRIISGLEEAGKGEIYIDGRNITMEQPQNRQVAMVFQNYALYPHMTVYKNAEYCLRVRKVPKEERHRKVMEALKTVELADQANKLPNQLSGGQRQRVALARAIVKNPAVFLMDEPLSNLDAKLRNQMRRSILELHKSLGTTFVYVTHDQTEAMTMGDNIVLLNEGVIVQQGSPKEMYTNPNHIFVAGFIGNPPTNIVKTGFGYVGIRPEDIRLAPPEKPAWILPGHVTVCEPTGSFILYDVETPLGMMVVTAENTWGETAGQMNLWLLKDKMFYFDSDGRRIYEPWKEEGEFSKIIDGFAHQY